jgi:hypothetical protein
VKSSLANQYSPSFHATWKGMAIAARAALIWVAVKNPAPGQERNF